MKNNIFTIMLAAVPLVLCLVACSEEEVSKPSELAFEPESELEVIAFIRRNTDNTISKIHVMNPDGSNVRLLENGGSLVDRQPVWSADGKSLAYLDVRSNISIVTMDGLISKPMDGWSPHSLTWSPDGIHFAFESQHRDFEYQGHEYGGFRIYITSINSPAITAISSVVDTLFFLDMYPSWSPNGEKIAFSSVRPGAGWVWNDDMIMDVAWEIYVMNPDGSAVTRLTDFPLLKHKYNPVWSPDGKKIAFDGWGNGNNSWSIYVMNADGSNIFQVTDNLSQDAHSPTWSPDGTRLAFVSDHDGNSEIYVINIDGTGLKRLTHDPREDYSPAWSPGEI